MLRLELIEGLRIIIIALLSYLPTVAISGWFEAWVAKKSGDELPEQLGFLTLDPMIHFNIAGFAALLIGQLFGDYLTFFKGLPGWGRYIPLSPSGLNKGKILLQFSARAVAHFIMMLSAFGVIIILMHTSFLTASQATIAATTPIMKSISSVLIFFYQQNLMLCVIYCVIGFFRAFLFSYFPEFHMFSSQHIIYAVLLLFIFILLGSQIVEILLSKLMAFLSYKLMPH